MGNLCTKLFLQKWCFKLTFLLFLDCALVLLPKRGLVSFIEYFFFHPSLILILILIRIPILILILILIFILIHILIIVLILILILIHLLLFLSSSHPHPPVILIFLIPILLSFLSFSHPNSPLILILILLIFSSFSHPYHPHPPFILILHPIHFSSYPHPPLILFSSHPLPHPLLLSFSPLLLSYFSSSIFKSFVVHRPWTGWSKMRTIVNDLKSFLFPSVRFETTDLFLWTIKFVWPLFDNFLIFSDLFCTSHFC